MSGVRSEGADDRHNQTHQQRHRLEYGTGDVRVEASGDRSRQERESRKSDDGQSSVHEIVELQRVFPRTTHVNPAAHIRYGRMLEIGIPQTRAGHNPVVKRAVLGLVAVRETCEATNGAEDEEGDTRHHFLHTMTVAVVGGQGC